MSKSSRHSKSEVKTEEAGVESDADFRLVLRSATVMILDNLARALEYEKAGFTEVAKKRGMKNYLDIMAPQHFEGLFREFLEIGQVSTSFLPPSSASHSQENFRYLLQACKTAPYKGTPAKTVLTAAFQKACTATQASLKACADAADASDLKLHLFFFINALNIMQGDIAGKPGLLHRNIDAFTSGERVGDAPLPH
jgi:hypothetical protein